MFVIVNGARLHVVDQGSGPAILFVHGFPLDLRMWRAQIERLSLTHRVVAPDLRGFGQSAAAGDTVTMGDFAGDLARLLHERGVTEPITLCGLSMGGYIAFAFVEQYREQVGRLVLCDTRAVADTAEAAAARRELADRVVAEGVEVLASAMLPRLLSDQTRQQRPGVVDELLAMIRSATPAGAAAALRGMAVRPDVRDRLATIRIPTLVIVGAQDAISPPSEMRPIAGALGAAFVEIAGAGHMTPMEAPRAFNDALVQFLAS